MRSYSYLNGIWDVIDDPVPNALKRIDVSPGQYSEYIITQFGFSESHDTFNCISGQLRVYAKGHEKLAGKRVVKELPYDFLCILRLGRSDIRIWVTDFPSVLLLVREVEVKSESDTVSRILKAITNSEVLESVSFAMKDISSGDVEITVKQ